MRKNKTTEKVLQKNNLSQNILGLEKAKLEIRTYSRTYSHKKRHLPKIGKCPKR